MASVHLRIAMIAPPWFEIPPSGYGGIEQVCAALVDGLVTKGHEVTLFGAGRRTGTRASFIPTVPEPQFRNLGQALPELLHIARADRFISAGAFDVVHDHTSVGALAAPLRPAPTVMTIHATPEGDLGDYLACLDHRVHLVAISDAQRRVRPDIGWAATIHNGLTKIGPARPAGTDGPVLWLARFDPDKGPDLAIHACRAAGLPLVLVGKCRSAQEYRYLEEVVQPLLGPDTTLVLNGSRNAVDHLLATARCLIMPIRWNEPFGMVMIEAMAIGTPVVALRRGAAPEVIDHGRTGFICDDPAELPAALTQVTAIDPRDCVAHVRRYFSAETLAHRYEEAYQAALAQRASSRLRATREVRGAPAVAAGVAVASPIPVR